MRIPETKVESMRPLFLIAQSVLHGCLVLTIRNELDFTELLGCRTDDIQIAIVGVLVE